MPPLKTPESLFNLCVEFVSEWFSMEWYAEQGAEHSVSAIKVLPSVTFNVVVGDIIKRVRSSDPPFSHYNKLPVTSMFSYLFTQRLTYLDLSTFKPVDSSLRTHFNESFRQALPELGKLVYLSLERSGFRHCQKPPTCDEDILFYIGAHCHSLKYLNMSNNTVTDKTVLYLIPSENHGGCPLLEDLILKDCSLTPKCLVDMLHHLPNIKNIHHNNLYEAVQEFCSNSNSTSPCVNLKLEYLPVKGSNHRQTGCLCKTYCSDDEVMSRISTLCPEIKAIEFMLIDKEARKLKFFPNVSDLVLIYDYNRYYRSREDESRNYYSLPEDESKNYFLQSGYKLKKLDISCYQFHTEFFRFLAKTCYHLKELSVQCYTLVHDLNFDVKKDNTLKVFPLLTTFSLDVAGNATNAVPIDALRFILKSTHSLTHLKLKLRSMTLTDESFKQLWNSIDTRSLVDLHIVWHYREQRNGVRVTMLTVKLALERCPQLMVLGNLLYWDVPKEEIEPLRKSLKKSNYDVKILIGCECGIPNCRS